MVANMLLGQAVGRLSVWGSAVHVVLVVLLLAGIDRVVTRKILKGIEKRRLRVEFGHENQREGKEHEQRTRGISIRS
jgi:hypothetical protein